MSKAVSMILFDGTFETFEAVRKFVRDSNLVLVNLEAKPKKSFLILMSGEKAVKIKAGEMIVRKADGILSKRKKSKGRGYAGDL